jgi:hypothetical protein
VFPVRYELNLYILFRRNYVLKTLQHPINTIKSDFDSVVNETTNKQKRIKLLQNYQEGYYSMNDSDSFFVSVSQ